MIQLLVTFVAFLSQLCLVNPEPLDVLLRLESDGKGLLGLYQLHEVLVELRVGYLHPETLENVLLPQEGLLRVLIEFVILIEVVDLFQHVS